MRLTTDFWVSALTRRVFHRGGFAAVLRKGAGEAGAIFLLRRDRFGGVALYGPAPQASYDETRPSDRAFALLLETVDDETVSARMARETRFDPDLWLVEIEPGEEPLEALVDLRTP